MSSSTQISKNIRDKLKAKFPKSKFSVSKKDYAGGWSLSITLLESNIQVLSDELEQTKKESKISISQYYLDSSSNLSEEGKKLFKEVYDIALSENPSFSNKHSSSFLHLYVGDYKNPFVYTGGKSISSTKSFSKRTESKFDRGEILKECAGWKIYKKTLPDGRIVYNAIKDKETPPNKGDWNAIKGEIYVETGFKWGRFGAFEKWGVIASEAFVLNRLCEILSKYYTKPTTEEPKQEKEKAVEKPAEEPKFVINESYKSLPANPLLEYCKIVWAEGLLDYSKTFPKTFQSWTALSKYIADNIQEVPTQGYDKHRIEWKWKFEDEVQDVRMDVSKAEADPTFYPNLYVYHIMSYLCYYAWVKNGLSEEKLKENDEFFADKIGKVGFEMDNKQFNMVLNHFLTYWSQDIERFSSNTPEQRMDRFKIAYPKLYQLFNTEEKPTKQQIQDTIDALQILADMGNSQAQETIDALKFLI